jgi:hypothetical protein
MTIINQTDIDEYWRLHRETGVAGGKIEKRIEYVLRRIYQEFDAEIDYWYFSDAPEGDVGSLHKALGQQDVTNYIIEPMTYGKEMVIKLDDGKYAEFGYGFPIRWLYEDFEDELTRGKVAHEQEELDKKAAKAAARAARKAAKERLKASAASKLTTEEKKALGLS